LIWGFEDIRATKDMDFSGYGDSDSEHVKKAFYEICSINSNDDGIVFPIEHINVKNIRKGQSYGGFNVSFLGFIKQVKINLHVDGGFGDVITPKPEENNYPTLLKQPVVTLLTYNIYSFVAEKFETIVKKRYG
jgi:hypothetical protein